MSIQKDVRVTIETKTATNVVINPVNAHLWITLALPAVVRNDDINTRLMYSIHQFMKLNKL